MMLSTSAQISEDRNGYASRYDRYSPSSAAAIASDNLIRLPGIPLPLTACCSIIPQGTATGNGSGAMGDIVWPVGCVTTPAPRGRPGRAGKHSVNASRTCGANRNLLSGGHKVERVESPNRGKGDEPGLSSAWTNVWSWRRALQDLPWRQPFLSFSLTVSVRWLFAGEPSAASEQSPDGPVSGSGACRFCFAWGKHSETRRLPAVTASPIQSRIRPRTTGNRRVGEHMEPGRP